MTILSDILRELSYRVESGIPDLGNIDHLVELSNIFNEYGIPETVITEEADGIYRLPILNRMISYRNVNGIRTQGRLGDLLRVRRGHPARIEAEKALPSGIDRDEVNYELGTYNNPKLRTEEEKENTDNDSDELDIDALLADGEPPNDDGGESEPKSDVDVGEKSTNDTPPDEDPVEPTTDDEKTDDAPSKPTSDSDKSPDAPTEPSSDDDTPDTDSDIEHDADTTDDTEDSSDVDSSGDDEKKQNPLVKYDKILQSILGREADIIKKIAQDPLRYYK